MKEHITPERLYELAQLRTVVEEPEWREHIRHCPECGMKYIQFVKNRAEAKRDTRDEAVNR